MASLKIKTQRNPGFESYTGKYHDNNSYYDVINYIISEEKTPHQFIGGYGVNLNQAAYEMDYLAKVYGKESGIRLRHFILSFSPEEVKYGGIKKFEALYKIGQYAALFYSDEYQIVFAVHEDKDHPHIHFVMNTTNYRTGAKYQGDKKDYYAFQNYIDDFLWEQYRLRLHVYKD